MAITYPGTIDVLTNPTSANNLSSPDHATQHQDSNDAIEAIESVMGTTAGTSVLKDFVAGNFPARVNSSNVLQHTVSGTVNNSVIGTPSITGGTISASVGTLTTFVLNSATVGTPAITGGTANAITLGTPVIGNFTNATHDHTNNAGGGTVSHLSLSNIGTVTHGSIDANLARLANTSGNNTGDQVVPANEAGAANNFLTAYNSTTGAWSKAQPTWANIDKTSSNISDITTKSHTSLSDIGTATHATIDSHIAGTGTSVHGLKNMAVQDPGSISITGGTINSVTVGTPTITGGSWATGTLGTPTLTLGSDATGDLFFRSAGGTVNRLGIGSNGQFLTTNGTTPSWGTVSVTGGVGTVAALGPNLTGGTITTTGTIALAGTIQPTMIGTTTIQGGTITSSAITLANSSPTASGGIGYDQTNNELQIGNGSTSEIIRMGVWDTWSPTFGGFSANPASPTCRYMVVGKICFLHVNTGTGTSNATTFTITAPLTHANTVAQLGYGQGTDNGAYAPHVLVSLAANSTTMTLTKDGGSSAWTASGNKGANFFIFYEVV